MGIRKAASTVGKAVKVLALAGVMLAVFIGGRGTSSGWSWEAIKGGNPSKEKPADVDKMLDSMGPPAGSTQGAGGPGGAAAASGAAGTGGAGGAAAEVSQTGDPDIDGDPLIQAAGGKRIGAKGLTMEQALAASRTLAKSVGNTTAERAMAGASVGPTPGVGKAESGGSVGAAGGTQANGAVAAAAATAGAGPAAQAAASGGGGTSAETSVSPQVKQLLALEFTAQLAEMGQLPRAQQMIKALKSSPRTTSDPAVASAARVADMEVRAWSMQSMGDSKARAAADALMSDAAGLADPYERAAALSRVGAILARHPQLPTEASRAFLTKAVEFIKALPEGTQRQAATSRWAVSFGEALLAEAVSRAKSGQWPKAQHASAQLDTLLAQAPDTVSQARLNAISYQMKLQLGQPDKAGQHMDAGVLLAARVDSLPDRAALLRSMTQLSVGVDQPKLRAAIEALQAQAAAKGGVDRARTLAQLSLLFAEAGLRGKASELADAARATPGLSGQTPLSQYRFDRAWRYGRSPRAAQRGFVRGI
jgi:hypothetical protein